MENARKEDQIINQLKMVYDPEIPVNVYDLGLIYDCKILAEDRVEILMTLTSPSCSMAEMIVEEVKERVSRKIVRVCKSNHLTVLITEFHQLFITS